jgi:CBS domain-containing protein
MIDTATPRNIGGLSEPGLWGTTEIDPAARRRELHRRSRLVVRRTTIRARHDAPAAGNGEDETMTDSLRPSEIFVRDVMHEGILTCSSETPLRTVATMMVEQRVHCIAVLADREESYRVGALWGIVSDLDLAGSASDDMDARTAGGAAASPVVTVTPTETVERAAQLMREYGTAHLVVVAADDNRPLGVISTLDVAALLGRMPFPVAR